MLKRKKPAKVLMFIVSVLMILATMPEMTYAVGTTYYVDSISGNDQNNGTGTGTPWKSLSKVQSITYQPGDSILFKRGSSWNGTLTVSTSGSSAGQITYGAYGTGNKPIINGNGSYQAVKCTKSYITIRDLDITNNATTGDRNGIYIYASGANLTDIQILDCDIHHIKGRYGYDDYYSSAGISSDGYTGNVDNLLIEGNNIHDNECQGIYTRGTTTSGDGNNGIRYNNLIVRNNTFDRNVKGDIIVGKALNPLIEYNVSTNAGQGYTDFYYMVSMWEFSCLGSTFQYNEVANVNAPNLTGGGDSQAFDVDINSRGTHIFQYNYTHNNEGGTLLVMWTGNTALESTVYRYNISQNDGHFNCNPYDLSTANDGNKGSTVAINSSGTSGTYIYNNIWYNDNGSGIRIKDSTVAYKNNIFYSTSDSKYPLTRPQYDSNCYYGSDVTVVPTTDANSVLQNPNFVNPGTGENGRNTVDGYKLQSNSPCINQGVRIDNHGGKDYWGNPLYNGDPDIGAFESNVLGWGTTVLFTDGFESGNLTTGDWVNSGCGITTDKVRTGIYSVQFNNSDILTKSLSTVGYGGIKVQYGVRTKFLETDDHFIAEWYDGSTWTTLEDDNTDFDFTYRTWDLPSSADGNPNFQLRFKTVHNGSTDYANIDDVKISASMTLAPLNVAALTFDGQNVLNDMSVPKLIPGEHTIEAKVNNHDMEQKLTLISALYKKDTNDFVGIRSQEKVVPEEGSAQYHLSVNVPDDAQKYRVRILCWDSLVNLAPLVKFNPIILEQL